jgi:hypothetical protein
VVSIGVIVIVRFVWCIVVISFGCFTGIAGALLIMVFAVCWASCFRASYSSNCLVSISSAVSLTSGVGVGWGFFVLGVGFLRFSKVDIFRPAISLPFIVRTIFGFGRVTTWPLDVGRSESMVICRSGSGCVDRAVRSIRFVRGI